MDYDPRELTGALNAIEKHNPFFSGSDRDFIEELIHANMRLLHRERGTYCSTAGFVITRYEKAEGGFAFKISVSASLFSEATS